MKVSAYWKTVIASLSPVLLATQAAVDDGRITGEEWVTIGLALCVAVGVWRVPNRRRS